VSLNENALKYHAAGRPGKVKVVPTTPCATADDLSLAYSPGVAAPCLAIEKEPEDAYKYTAKGNLVAVLSNGSAVLGLGNIGALAGKPVMEGKGVLFKRFADIDVFDIEVDSQDTAEIIRFCEMIAPTFGGINLEDIRAPECFEIEEKLKESLDIPVFHDDQHGTAIISAAALLNGLEIQDKKIDEVKVVFSGAGAAAISCAKLYKDIGVKAENIIMCDSRGVMWDGRGEGYNKYKDEFVAKTDARTLEDSMVGCDVFVGLSQKGLVSQDMVKSMADRPMIFAMANPDPEITPIDAKAARSDAICATGRSDYANQVNNVLGFPFIFRGALDVRASKINEEMKQAATYALAELAKRDEPVPDAVKNAYPGESFDFGPEYIIPKPFDSRVLLYVAPAVAKAAMESGVARSPIDLDDYQVKLNQMLEEVRSL
jgi:malate dehydrogenase (oxaloacetate-decarboxylating)(NADP+)